MAGEPRDQLETRSSDAEREATLSRLREAAGEGRLTLEELAERVAAADAARTSGELAELVADLPAVRPAAVARRRLPAVRGGRAGGCRRFAAGARDACYSWLGKALAVLTDGEFGRTGCAQLAGTARRSCEAGAAAMDGPLVTFS